MLRSVKRAIRRQKERLEGSSYTYVQNLQNRLKRSPIHLGYDAPLYWCSDTEMKLYFASKTRSKLYGRGIGRRLSIISRDYMLDQISIETDDTVIDCGANIGEFGLALARVNPPGRYIAFEPAPLEFACLKRNMPEGDLRQTALWHSTTEMTFYLDSAKADSSLIDTGRSHGEIKVPCMRLDEAISDEPIKLLKIEAEGAEPEVLSGSEKLLPNCEFVVVDTGPERGQTSDETTPSVANFMLRHGFDLVRIRHDRVVLLFRRRA